MWNKFVGTSIDAEWDENVHGGAGQIVLSDGSAHLTTTSALRDQISEALNTGSTNVVFSKPRGVL